MAPPDTRALLQRVLLLERQQGFQNRAAVGGLGPFLRAQEERADASSRPLVAAVREAIDDYDAAGRAGREAAIAAALRTLLGAGEGQPVNGRQTAPAPPAAGPAREVGQPPQPSPPVTPSPPPRRERPKVNATPEDLNRQVVELRGVGKHIALALEKLGVRTLYDLLYFFPRAHYDYTDTSSISRMRVGQKTTLVGTVQDVRTNRTRRGIAVTTVAVSDATGTAAVRFFNQPYITKQFPLGRRVAISGEPDIYNGYIVFQPRDYELIEDEDLTHTARLVPIYPLTKGLYQRSLRKLVRTVVEDFSPAVEDPLPPEMLNSLKLPDLQLAIRQYHFPEDDDSRDWAQQRLAFDELLMIQLGLLMRKRDWQQELPDVAIPTDGDELRHFSDTLPFRLTSAQERALGEIVADLRRPAPMTRLLEGDVGSGKTVVAAAALLQVVRAGKQAVLMAPTEILAEQHYQTLEHLLSPFGIRTRLLIGSTRKKARTEINALSASGDLDVLVGTHALIQEGVSFQRLGLAITDEQHRFGVEQRLTLRQKGLNPHTLAMTATPIPRTLAMTIYGDLDVSVIDEMPPGRLPIVTTWCRSPGDAYGVVRDEVRKGKQAFVICPVIEESAESDMRSVVAEFRELSTIVFSDLKVGLLHGKMKPSEKERTLASFRGGEYDILVATSVVEVGIDIPNATVMVIRDAHRFGLAQLHQFRGRVGRGGDQAYCVLLSATEGDGARERLEALTATENGFELAEEDLRLRGPGEFWGTRQSGLPELRVAQLGDVATIMLARQAAQSILESDPDLTSPSNRLLAQRVARFWREEADLS